jgi:hypothetical protein
MSGKKIVGLTVGAILLVALVWTGIAAASIGGEASSLDSMLKTATNNHEPILSVLKKVKDMGFEMKPTPNPSNPAAGGASGRGPDHWAVVYRTWLTLNLDSGPDATTTGYHIDRAGSVF